MYNHYKSNFGILDKHNKLAPRWYMPIVVGIGIIIAGGGGVLLLGTGIFWAGYKAVETVTKKFI